MIPNTETYDHPPRAWSQLGRSSLLVLLAVSASMLIVPGQSLAQTACGMFAATWGLPGASNGQFNRPRGVAVNSSGTVYVVDSKNNRVQYFTAAGLFLGRFGSIGQGNGEFDRPRGIAIDASGNVYVTDRTNNRVQKFTSAGAFLAKWGVVGTAPGQFSHPQGIAIDGAGNVYVADGNNHRIQKFTSAGTFLSQWGSIGSGNGQFISPRGLAVDSADNVYVVDRDNHRIQKFDSSGVFISKFGGLGSGAGQFLSPRSVAVDAGDNVYVTDGGNDRVQKFSSTGVLLLEWGSSGILNGQFKTPYGVALDASNNIYITDTDNHRVQKFSCQGCGNAIVEAGEQCDGGGAQTGLCCTSACVLEPAGTACTDGNLCTQNQCNALGTCNLVGNAAGPCDDGSFCNGADTCSGGSCSIHTGDPCAGGLECANVCEETTAGCNAPFGLACTSDGNICTDNVCNGGGICIPQANSTLCDDGNACTTSDVCSAGACVGGPPPVCDDGLFCNGLESCNPASGCVPGARVDCSDGVTCTVDSCNEVANICEHTPQAAACDNGLFCDGAETCNPTLGCQAGTPMNCDDVVACTIDSCSDATAACVNTPSDALCADTNACTDDVCDPALGCTITNDNTNVCSNGNPADDPDSCVAGVCMGSSGCQVAGIDCDDGNPCTDDVCLASGACTHTANTAPCNDGNACTTGDTCGGGTCTGGATTPCDDGVFCNGLEDCNPTSGCVAGTPVDCSDGVACTADSCNEASNACDHAPLPAACDNGLFCDGQEICHVTLGCQAGTPVACSDAVVCTVDSCNEATDTCDNLASDGLCDDGNACTDDACNPALGCVSINDDTNVCSNGNPADDPDRCTAGVCLGIDGCLGDPANCDDGNPCTDDSCLATGACGHANNTSSCDDGSSCTVGDSCSAGTCIAGATADCDDGDVCTNDSCDPMSGCQSVANSDHCDDGDPCTAADLCSGGSCGGTPTECNQRCVDLPPGGGTVTTDVQDDGATTSDPIETSVTSAFGGEVCITESILSGGGVRIDIVAPASTAVDPLSIRLRTDSSLGYTVGVDLAKDGQVLADCTGTPAAAEPDPCLANPSILPDGDLELTALSSAAGLWSVGVVFAGCPLTPMTGCLNAAKAKLDIKDIVVASKDQLKWKWKLGDAVDQAQLGNPASATDYALCVYDSVAGLPSLATTLSISADPLAWQDKSPRGFGYKDKGGTQHGVQKVKLKPSTQGRSQAQIKARGANLPLPPAFDAANLFDQDPAVTVQLINADGTCWTTAFTPLQTKRHTGVRFSATMK